MVIPPRRPIYSRANSLRYPCIRRYGEEINLVALPGIQSRLPGRPACSLSAIRIMLARLLISRAIAVFMQLVLRKFITPSRDLELYLAQTVNHHRVLVWNPIINFIEIEVSYLLSFVILLVYCGYKSSIDRISYGCDLLSEMLSVPVWFNLSNLTRADKFSRLSLNTSHFEKMFHTHLITHTNTCIHLYILFKKSKIYIKTFKTLLHVSITRSSSGSVYFTLLKL